LTLTYYGHTEHQPKNFVLINSPKRIQSNIHSCITREYFTFGSFLTWNLSATSHSNVKNEREDKHEIDIKRHYLHRNSEKMKFLLVVWSSKNILSKKEICGQKQQNDYLFKESFHLSCSFFCYLSKLLPHTIFYIFFIFLWQYQQ